MSAQLATPASTRTPPPKRKRWDAKVLGVLGALALIAAMLASTTYRSASEPVEGARVEFDPATYGAETYASQVVPAIEDSAVDLVELVTALQADPEAAGEEYGQRQGTGPYSFAISVTGTAGTAENGQLPLTVDGLGSDVRVAVQIGPAVNGSALRDAAGFIEFGQFRNQLEYADAATALNTEMKAAVLADLDVASLAGQTVTVVGAATVLDPAVIILAPVSIDVAS